MGVDMTDKLAKVDEPITLPVHVDPYAPTSHSMARDQAKIVAESGLYGLETPAQAYVVLMTGHDLGLSPSQALRGVHVIENKPSPSADTLHAVCLASPVCEYFRHVETTAEQSTWETKRVGEPPERGTYTIQEARTAGLIKPKGNWEKHPRRMLKARAKAFLARDVYPDLTLGLYTPDELRETERVSVERVEELPTELSESIDPDPWQDRMRRALEAGDRRLATQIGMDAWNAADKDMDVKAEALAILGEGSE
jgi:hypothetical protein